MREPNVSTSLKRSLEAMWLDEPAMFMSSKPKKDESPKKPAIKGWRRTEHADLERINQFVRMKTYDIFGDIIPATVLEASVLSLVQINEEDEVVSNISLCNYPNIPSVPPYDWLKWIYKHYGMSGINERNALFVHLLVWDTRYNNEFFKRILDTVFACSTHTTHVVLIMPPWVTPVDLIEEQMTRIVPFGENDSYRVQALYVSLRHMHCPRLKMRRVVEEDNDDIVPIVEKETERLRELYGEFYISEMMRYPDGLRQLVVAETDGLATGVLCLNKTVDIDTLNDYFELGPYQGLRKPHREDAVFPLGEIKSVSEVLFPEDAKELREKEESRKRLEVEEVEVIASESTIADRICTCDDSEDLERRPCPVCFPMKVIPRPKGIEISHLEFEPVPEGRTEWQSTADLDKHVSINPMVTFRQMQTPDPESEQAAEEAPNELENAVDPQETNDPVDPEDPVDPTRESSSGIISKVSSGFQSRLRNSVFAETISGVPRRSVVGIGVKATDSKLGEQYAKAIPIPRYYGEPNAFTLELFSMQNDVDERQAYDYLEAAFECFPDQDYCLILIPPSFPTFPLLQSFVRVPLRFNKDYPLVLYLAHRASVIGQLRSRLAVPYDRLTIANLVEGIPKSEAIMRDFDIAIGENATTFYCYVFICEESIVGVAILSVETEIEFVRSRYHIDDYISYGNVPPDSHGRIIHMVMMPIFTPYHRFFFREVMRIGEMNALYYRLYKKDASALTRREPLATFLGEMMPVAPRRQLKYCLKNYLDNQPRDFVLQPMEETFALYMMVRRIAIIVKRDLNTRIVVVGASDCGLALLDELGLGPNAYSVGFTNLTLVSDNGMPFEKTPDDLEHEIVLYRGRYCHSYSHLLGSRVWINVVRGTMTAINRKDKYLTIGNMGILSYDYLIIAGGLQYHRPKFPAELEAEKRGKVQEIETPSNCFLINNQSEAAQCLNRCKTLMEKNPASVFVMYGHNLDCYCALAALLKTGVKGSLITLIEPMPQMCETHDETFFNDAEVDEAIMNTIKESGVETLVGWELTDWTLVEAEEAKVIKSLILETKTDRKEIPCDALFNFREKTINSKMFMAICRAGLVFDGELVIDPEFQTNDPYIFAAGTITKYSRRYYADNSSHKYNNRVEIGGRLGKKLRNMMEQIITDEQPYVKPASKLDMMLPVFIMPIVVYCLLPGGYHYLHVQKPGKMVPIDRTINQETYGDVLITGSSSSSIGYFRLHLNCFNAVDSVTCLSKQKSLVSDLYAYFREPWAVALFYDRFDCLRVENRATLVSSTVVLGDSLTQDALKALLRSRWDAVSDSDREILESRYAGSVYQENLEASLIEFLQYAEDHLPMYCNPRKLRHVLEETDESPLFRPK